MAFTSHVGPIPPTPTPSSEGGSVYDPAKELSAKEQIEALEHRLKYHKVTDAMPTMKMERLRADALAFGISILSNAPTSRERERALDAVDDALKHAIAAIARDKSVS